MLGALVVMTAVSRPPAPRTIWKPVRSARSHDCPPTTLDSIMQRLEALEAKADDKKKEAPKEDEWKDVSAEKWTFKFGGRALADYVMFADQDAGNQARFGDLDNYFEWRRLRLRAEGEGYGVYFYRVELEFEPEGVAGLADSGVAHPRLLMSA